MPTALPTDEDQGTLTRYAALGEALLEQFPGRLSQLDCGPTLGVRPFWASPPTSEEVAAFDATVNGWDFGSRPNEDLERKVRMPRAVAAMILRASDRWAALSPARKARITAIINAAADKVIAAL